jgi:hypothetical protein
MPLFCPAPVLVARCSQCRQEVGVARNSRERLAKHALGAAAAIDIRRVEEIDPKVEGLIDACHRLALLDASRIGQPRA